MSLPFNPQQEIAEKRLLMTQSIAQNKARLALENASKTAAEGAAHADSKLVILQLRRTPRAPVLADFSAGVAFREARSGAATCVPDGDD